MLRIEMDEFSATEATSGKKLDCLWYRWFDVERV